MSSVTGGDWKETLEECKEQLQKLFGKNTPEAVAAASSLVQQMQDCVTSLCLSPSPATHLLVVKKMLEFFQLGENSNGLFEALGSQLTNLFKSTYTLLKDCLDATLLEQSLIQCKLSTLLMEIVSVASLSLHFDPSLLALCWRSVSKLSSCCLDSFAVLPHIITELCGAIMAVAKQSAMLVDSLIEKRLKSGRFLCSLLLRYFSAFPEVAETCGRVTVDMLLSVHQTIHSVNDVSLRSKLESSFLLLHEPLLQSMSSSLAFVHHLLDHSSVCDGQHYGWALLLASLFKYISDGVLCYCLEAVSGNEASRVSCRIMDCVFICFDECHCELSASYSVPPTLCNGQLQCATSLYEWVCSHIFVLLSELSKDSFQHLENYLMSRLLTSHTFCLHLAADCLVFLARLGGDSVVSTYCEFILDFVESVACDASSHTYCVVLLGSVLNRLLLFLPSMAQILLLSRLNLHKSLFWCHIQPDTLHPETLRTKELQQVFSSGLLTLMEAKFAFHKVGSCLYCLRALCRNGLEVDNLCKTLLQIIQSRAIYSCELSVHHLCLLLPVLPPRSSCEMLSCLTSQFTSFQQSLSLALSLCCFLISIKETSATILPQHYYLLLSTPHWLVRHHALECFRVFAEVTADASVVEACVPPSMTNSIIDFLHKIPVHQGKVSHYNMMLSHPSHPLATLHLPPNNNAIKDLESSWQRVQNLKEDLCTSSLVQLANINASISSFLGEHFL